MKKTDWFYLWTVFMLVFIPATEIIIIGLAFESLGIHALIPVIMVVSLFTFCEMLVYDSYKEQNNAVELTPEMIKHFADTHDFYEMRQDEVLYSEAIKNYNNSK